MAKCWIFDIDGTLADTTHREVHLHQDKKDWNAWNAAMSDDGCHGDILDLLFYAENILGMEIVMCTGREERFREVTLNWLLQIGVNPAELYMRPNGDFCKDDILKKRMLDQMRGEGYDPVMVLEDRSRVVRMWRENGIRCLQVANGDF